MVGIAITWLLSTGTKDMSAQHSFYASGSRYTTINNLLNQPFRYFRLKINFYGFSLLV